MSFTRRSALGLLGASTLGLSAPVAFAGAPSDRKFIFIILRGAMDGLGALIPTDPRLDALREDVLPEPDGRLSLTTDFTLHPSLTQLKSLYDTGEAAFVHAAATPYRERSHFDGQDFLEVLDGGGAEGGWLNRAVAAQGGSGLSISYALPLALQGPARASNWAPPVFREPNNDLLDRLGDLYAGDPLLAGALAEARALPETVMMGEGRQRQSYAATLGYLGQMMAAKDGPSIGTAALDGWDTHAGQIFQLGNRLEQMDEAIIRLKDSLGADWDKTVIVLCSEFGRTARANGTRGTDHGTGGLMILTGGAIRGGKVYGDWPGLKDSQLYEGRDLYPANDVTAVLKGVLRDHLGLDRRALDMQVFPGSGAIMEGLIRAT